MIVHFKSVEHRFLSNFYPIEMEYRGLIFPSSEHAYMSEKSNENVEINGIKYNWRQFCTRKDIKPGKIKGESRFLTLRDNWNKLKVGVMYNVLVCKFSNPQLKERLLATGTENIQEGNWHGDIFWGVDLRQNPNIGENHLGRLLMQLRDEIAGGDY